MKHKPLSLEERRRISREYKQEWRKRNPDKDKKYVKEYSERNKEKLAAYRKLYNEKNPKTYDKDYAYQKKYGISLTDRNHMALMQRFQCAACSEPTDNNKLCVDHDHRTGSVRGMLCPRCNFALGHIENDNLINLLMYMMKHKSKSITEMREYFEIQL